MNRLDHREHGASSGERIAIVGIGCRYPGANGPKELWENVLAKRQQFRSIPECRLPREGYYSADQEVPDRTYAWQLAVLDGYAFDWQARRVPKSAFEVTDIAHWLALDTAIEMLDDAGYTNAEGLPKQTTRVIVGNSLTGEFTRANYLRLRWPYVLSCVRAATAAAGWKADAVASFERYLESIYKAPFPQTNEDSLAGGLSNTIPGRIANYLNLNGGCYTTDGACSSSLLAIHAGASSLVAGQCDFVIAGGVDISLDPFELIGFAKVGALTPTQMRVYDVRGNGFIPGEGCGFVGLKRMDDAIRDQDKIYAVLDGWGMSSDGHGGITAPNAQGQHLSHAMAYRQARVSPQALDFVEGHGTATPAGDRAELRALGMTLAESEGDHRCGVTSFKSIIGHAKAASGIGALIKTVVAVNQRVLPPTAGCEQPHEAFTGEARALYPLIRGGTRDANDTLRAGVSAMGFGGVNVHVTLTSPDAPPDASLHGNRDPRSAMASWQDSEIFPLAASSLTELRETVARLKQDTDGISLAELADLAAHRADGVDAAAPWRAAVVADSPDQLSQRLDLLDAALARASAGDKVLNREHGFAFGNPAEPPRIGMLFPGQGAQRLGMARTLVERYPWARDIAEQAQQWAAKHGAAGLLGTMLPDLDRRPNRQDRDELAQTLQATEWAQPSIVLASLLWLQMLTRLGIRAECVAGHSLGELVAFHAAGAYGMQAAMELATVRGQKMAAKTDRPGKMLSLACSHAQAQDLIRANASAGYVVIANINSDRQVVVSGEPDAIDAIKRAATSVGIAGTRLPVSNAFHSRLVASAADDLRAHPPMANECGVLSCVLISSTTGLEVPQGVGLRDHFANQIVRPVDFVTTFDSMARHADVVLEVGPGSVLTNLAGNVSATRTLHRFPVESKAETWTDINWALASLHALGTPVAWRALHAERVIRPFVPARNRTFITNPCERPKPVVSPAETARGLSESPVAADVSLGAVDQLFEHLKRRSDYFVDVIKADMRNSARPETAASGDDVVASTSMAPPTSMPASAPSHGLAQPRTASLDVVAGTMAGGVERVGGNAVVAEPTSRPQIATTTATATVATVAPATTTAMPAMAAMTTTATTTTATTATAAAAAATAWPVLRHLCAKITGFSEEAIERTSRPLDDLNLDSIKSADLIARASEAVGIAPGVLDATALSALPLGEIAHAMDRAMGATNVPEGALSVPAEVSNSPEGMMNVAGGESTVTADTSNVLDMLFDEVSRVTGFDKAHLSPTSRMLDDLNLDSIKVAAILGEIMQRTGNEGAIEPSTLSNATLGEIATQIGALKGRSASVSAQVEKPQERSAIAATPVEKPQERSTSASVPLALPQGRTADVTEQPPTPAANAQHAETPDWVRAFELVPVPMPSTLNTGGIAGERFRVWPVERADTTHREIVAALTSMGADAIVDQDDRQAPFAQDDGAHHYIVVLPRRARVTPSADREYIASLVRPLHRSAATLARLRCQSVTFVQFGLGELFGVTSGEASMSPETSCAQAFAASLRMERLDLNVHILDFACATPDDIVVRRVLESTSDLAKYRLSFHDVAGKRYSLAPRVVDVDLLPARPMPWSHDDVVLATGGAKGITAELALAFARQTNAKIALVGRSDPDSAEVHATLARYEKERLRAEYFACDLCRPETVPDLIRSITRRLGAITGVIHGAGANVPRRAEQVSVEQAIDEASPKLKAALALSRALGDQPLKLVVGLGSIIGMTGMPGNAWYAFANQAMDVVLADLGARRPEVSTLTVNYSVWSDIGMGARLTSEAFLSKMGVKTITPQAGVANFLGLVLGLPPAKRIIVTSDLAGVETWQSMLPPPDTTSRFVDDVVRYQPGVEMVSRTTLSTERDPYLEDHRYYGVYLFPTVFGLEAMAACAQGALGVGLPRRFRFENVRLERPLIVSRSAGANIEIRALVRPRETNAERIQVDVSMLAEQTGYRASHFSCTVVFEAWHETRTQLTWPTEPLANLSPGDLYGRKLFHGPLFQRIKTLYAMAWSGSITRIEAVDQTHEPSGLIAGDPYFRDGLLQTTMLATQGDFLLAAVERIECHASHAGVSGTFFVKNEVVSGTEDTVVSDITVLAADGTIIERMIGCRLQRVSGDDQWPAPEDWVDPSRRDEALLSRAVRSACDALGCLPPCLSLRYAPDLAIKERAQRRAGELPQFVAVVESALAMQSMPVTSADIDIAWNDNGKPHLRGELGERFGVSLAHDASHCLCVCGTGAQGSDIETIAERDELGWRRILGNDLSSLLPRMMRDGDTLDAAGSRLWCALEAGMKSLGERSVTLTPMQRSGDAAMFLARAEGARQELVVLTLPCELTRHPEKMFAFVVRQTRDATVSDTAGAGGMPTGSTASFSPSQSLSPSPSPSLSVMPSRTPTMPVPSTPLPDTPGSQPASEPYVTTLRFRAAFKDSCPPVLTLSASTLSDWMGRLREEHAAAFGRQMLDDFDTGTYGAATNSSSIESIARADTTDLVEGRFWFTRQYGPDDSVLDQSLEWHRIDAQGNRQLIARAKMQTSWTRIVGHGEITRSPIPAYYADWLRPRLEAFNQRPQAYRSADAEAAPPVLSSPHLYRAPRTPVLQSILFRKTFETSLNSANLVGNVYYANYYRWQDITAEHYIHSISNGLPHPSAAREGFHCCSAFVNHLNEAMPFDKIEVVMAIKALHTEGFELLFEHNLIEGGGRPTKLAVGSACYVWTHRTPAGIVIQPKPLPEVLHRELLSACRSFVSA
ncbi:SDR family NAD(P)-dependent oxidoreductase [Pandoraea sp. NPDC087047]|uniref:SDR family NAD(P)-dependent oxidoreductase n=1 Tax=Pandoraea sp. NPDC087047 TaxID=3364390 RepID=UPI00380B3085